MLVLAVEVGYVDGCRVSSWRMERERGKEKQGKKAWREKLQAVSCPCFEIRVDGVCRREEREREREGEKAIVCPGLGDSLC